MKIEKTVSGWQIEPSTDDEEKALAFALKALEWVYCCSVEARGFDSANHLQQSPQSPANFDQA